MAEKRATLILQLKDQATKAINKTKISLQKLRSSWLAMTAAVGGAIAIGASAVKAFLKQESSISKLNTTLKNQGIYSQQTSSEIQKYAAELQKVTTVGDETLIEIQALLTSFGIMGDELNKATEASLDLSKGLGIDLKASALLLGKAMAGDISTLSRYGIKIKEGLPDNEKFNAVLAEINKKFGGAARAELDTYAGKIANLKNRFGDVWEMVGKQLIPILESLLTSAEKVATLMEKAGSAIRFAFGIPEEELSKQEILMQNLEQQRDLLIQIRNEKGFLTKEEERRLEVINKAIAREGKKLIQERKAEKERIKMIQKNLVAKQKAIIAEGKLRKTLDEDMRKAQIEGHKINIELERKKVQIVESSLSQIASLTTSTNKTLNAIGKAAAISLATIDAFRGANLALATIPPPFGFAMASAVMAAGMANVAQIVGIKLAEGGIVLPRPGGTIATLGEAGRPEAVIPLEDEDKGVGLTVNINAGVIVGGEDNMRELAKMIDQELFDLRRNRESVAFEAL